MYIILIHDEIEVKKYNQVYGQGALLPHKQWS